MTNFPVLVVFLHLFTLSFSSRLVIRDSTGTRSIELDKFDSIFDIPLYSEDEVIEEVILPQSLQIVDKNQTDNLLTTIADSGCTEKILKRRISSDESDHDTKKIARCSLESETKQGNSDWILVKTYTNSPIRYRLPSDWASISSDGLNGVPDARIIAFHLCSSITVESLAEFFQQFGKIDDAVHFNDFHNGQRSISIFQFRDSDSAYRAVNSRKKYSQDPNEIFGVDYCPDSFYQSSRYFRFTVPRHLIDDEGIIRSLEAEHLENKFGKIVSHRWINERKGYIVFNFERDARDAKIYLSSVGIGVRTFGADGIAVKIDKSRSTSEFVALTPSLQRTSDTSLNILRLPRDWRSISVDSLGGDPDARIAIFMIGSRLTWTSVLEQFDRFGKIERAIGCDDRVNGRMNIMVIQYEQNESASLAVLKTYSVGYQNYYDFGVDFCRHTFYKGNREMKFEVPKDLCRKSSLQDILSRKRLNEKFGNIISYRYKPGSDQGSVTFNFQRQAVAAKNYLQDLRITSDPRDRIFVKLLEFEEDQ